LVAFSCPRGVKLSKSSRFSSVHGSGGFVVRNDRMVVINVSFKYTFSHDGIVSLHGEISEFIGPSFDSRVL
jgi:hypothetical protein